MNQQAIVAGAFISRKNNSVIELLATKRASTKKFLPDKFEFPGGHIEFGEDIEAGLLREIQEELHIFVKVLRPFHVFTYTDTAMSVHAVEILYFARLEPEDQVITINSHDHSEYRWVAKDEALTLWEEGDEEREAVIKGFDELGKDFL